VRAWLPILFLALAAPVQAAAQVLELAEFVLDDGAVPPPDSAPWQPQALPDQWRTSRPEATGNGWYRFRFRVTEPGEPLHAVYLPRLVMNAAVWLNGRPIGDGGRFDEPVARNWNRPLIFLVPPGQLSAGTNTLHIRLRNHAYTQAALYPPAVGPEPLLRAEHEQAHFWQITVNQTATLLIAGIGLLTLSLWLRRRRDTAYAYFAASALLWAAQSTNLYIRDVPLDTAGWEILVSASFQVFSGFLLISLLRFVGVLPKSLFAVIWFGIFAAPASVLLAPAAYYLTLTSLWHLFTLAVAAATLYLLLRAALRDHNRDARFLVAALGLVLLFGLHDWLMHSRHLWFAGAALPLDHVFLLQYSAPLIFLAVGLIMTGRYVQALNRYESLNDELEQRVQEKHAQLQDSYARMRELEMEHVVVEERERIYRDLHDDVGAKLLSLVFRAGRPEDADLARSALRDLRDVVSRTGASSYRIEDVVADWRIECDQRLTEAAIALDWQVDGAPEGLSLSQPQALNLGRILREAISNVIHHAGARNVRVTIAVAGFRLLLEVRDDGRGMPAEQRPGGRGLRNMESRAARLGAVLSRSNAEPSGCIVSLAMPL
jgi:signal transduction histidine kinase